MFVLGETQPMKDKTQNRLELFNESFVLIYTYHLYLFTDFMTDLLIRDFIGQVFIYLAIFNIAVNILTSVF